MRQNKTSRLRKIALLASFAAVLPAIVVWQFTSYFDGARIRVLAEEYLQKYSPGRVTIESAEFSWLNGIILTGVSMADGQGDETDISMAGELPIFSCRRVTLIPKRIASLLGGLQIESVVAIEPTCRIVRNAADGHTNLADFLRMIESAVSEGTTTLPTIELRSARVLVIDHTPDSQRTVEDITLTVRGRPARQDSRYYELVWQEEGERFAHGHSRIDLESGRMINVKGGLPWLSIEGVMIAINAKFPEAGTWSDLLGIEGRVRISDYHFDGDAHARSVTVDLTDAALSIPIDDIETSLGATQRYLRFTEVNGTIEVSAGRIAAAFHGDFHGSRCEVRAELSGDIDARTTLEDVGIDVSIRLKNLSWPKAGDSAPADEDRFVHHWPALAKFYRDFDPYGPIDLDIQGSKSAGRDQAWLIERIVLVARGGGMNYRLFPYPVDRLEGTTEITPDGVFIRDLIARHEGAAITVNGSMSGVGPLDEAHISIVGRDVLIDQALVDALPPRFQEIYRQFQPAGTIAASVDVQRPKSVDGARSKWRTATRVTLQGVDARYEHFPYLITDLVGTFEIDHNGTHIRELRGRAGPGTVVVTGSVLRDDAGVSRTDIHVDATNLVVDDRLLSALPPGLEARVRTLHPTGRVDVQSVIGSSADTAGVVHASTIRLRDAAVQPDIAPVTIDKLKGVLHVTPRTLTLAGVSGECRGSPIQASGQIDLEGDATKSSLTLQSKDLRLDDDFYSSLPPELIAMIGGWRITGSLDVDVQLGGAPLTEQGGLSASATLRMNDAAIHHPRLPKPILHTSGTLTLNSQGARLTGLTGQYGPASIALDLRSFNTNGSQELSASLAINGLTLDESVLAMMPERLGDGLRWLAPKGTIDIKMDRLELRSGEEGKPPSLFVDGAIDLHDVSLERFGGLKGLDGRVEMQGWLIDYRQGTNLSGVCRLTRAEILDRRITNVESPWSLVRDVRGAGRVALESVRGNLYGGTLTAGAEIMLHPLRTRYSADATIRNMNIDEFLAAGRADSGEGKAAPRIAGKANARLHVSGDLGQTSTRRGQGAFEIVDGHIFRSPIILAILSVINLSVPASDAFHGATAEFLIHGNRVAFQEILLEGNALTLAGSGSMSLPDFGLDLYLINISPHTWARIPGLSTFIEGASRELVEFHVTGPISQPTVRAVPLRGITEELRRLFQRRKPVTASAESK